MNLCIDIFTKNRVLLKIWRSGEMADTTDLKSVAGNSVWVRVPPSLP